MHLKIYRSKLKKVVLGLTDSKINETPLIYSDSRWFMGTRHLKPGADFQAVVPPVATGPNVSRAHSGERSRMFWDQVGKKSETE